MPQGPGFPRRRGEGHMTCKVISYFVAVHLIADLPTHPPTLRFQFFVYVCIAYRHLIVALAALCYLQFSVFTVCWYELLLFCSRLSMAPSECARRFFCMFR